MTAREEPRTMTAQTGGWEAYRAAARSLLPAAPAHQLPDTLRPHFSDEAPDAGRR